MRRGDEASFVQDMWSDSRMLIRARSCSGAEGGPAGSPCGGSLASWHHWCQRELAGSPCVGEDDQGDEVDEDEDGYESVAAGAVAHVTVNATFITFRL